MERYSANYSNTGSNFVFQNINGANKIYDDYYGVFCILKNILQRGTPSTASEFLKSKLGDIYSEGSSSECICLISQDKPIWAKTIKGYEQKNYYPAKRFLYDVIPSLFGEYTFIQQLLLPEASFSDIAEIKNEQYKYQMVDFYLPQAKLVIEIDGMQHQTDSAIRLSDRERDSFLESLGINVTRIKTIDMELNNSAFASRIEEILSILANCDALEEYKMQFYTPTYADKMDVLRYAAIMRFQILILSLLQKGKLSLNNETWSINIRVPDVRFPAEIAVADLFLWLKHLCKLCKLPFTEPSVNIKYIFKETDSWPDRKSINIDFSLLKRWTDDVSAYPDVIFVRNDYFDDKNYFSVSCAESIKYRIISDGDDSDITSLQFVLKNIFGFKSFWDGQLPIVINALARNDTIGILPTGAGKSLCYQFCALLQPCISFVACPIKSLMYDQKDNLDSMGITRTNYITGDLKAETREKIQDEFANGKYMFIWISPERFQIQEFRDALREINEKRTLALAVIDEVHCLSEWGHEFRTSYLNLVRTIHDYCPAAWLLGLTATASSFVLEDLKKEFDIGSDNIKTTSAMGRNELNFQIFKLDPNASKYDVLSNILKELEQKHNIFSINGELTKSGIIFTTFKGGSKGCIALAPRISNEYNVSANIFYGGMTKGDVIQKGFKNNEYPLLVATKAFGMGIDKKNIRYTIHYGMPWSLEAFYQEAGRAGRDRNDAFCYIIYSPENIPTEVFEKLFSLDTTIEEIREMQEQYNQRDKDIMGIFYLWLQNNIGVNDELTATRYIMNNFVSQGEHLITCDEIHKFSDMQRAVYRLSLLGIIVDWTIADWAEGRQKINAEYAEFDVDSVKESLITYIRRYDKDFSLDADKSTDSRYTKYFSILVDQSLRPVTKYIKVLLEWSYDNIIYTRRQAIKTIKDVCDSFTSSNDLRRMIDNYFRFSDKTLMLDEIAQTPHDYTKWFEVMFDYLNSDKKRDSASNREQIENLMSSLSRFLESYRFNTGLNYISGLMRLVIGDFSHVDGKARLNDAFSHMKDYTDNEIEEVLHNTFLITSNLNLNSKNELSNVILAHFPHKAMDVYKNLNDEVSLAHIIEYSVEKLRKMEVV